MNLPQSFIENMSEILGPELDEYLESYEKPKFTGTHPRFPWRNLSGSIRLRVFAEFLGHQTVIIIQKRMHRQSILIIMQVFIIFRSQVP